LGAKERHVKPTIPCLTVSVRTHALLLLVVCIWSQNVTHPVLESPAVAGYEDDSGIVPDPISMPTHCTAASRCLCHWSFFMGLNAVFPVP